MAVLALAVLTNSSHSGMGCAAVSVITDECDPDNLAVADINDILKTAAVAEKDLIVLFGEMVRKLTVDSHW